MLEVTALTVFALPAYLLANKQEEATRSSTLLVWGAMTYLGSLIAFGGIKETGLYWIYVFPFVAFFLKGLRIGWKFCLAFLTVVCCYLLYLMPEIPALHQYSAEVRVNFLISLLFYTLVAATLSYLQQLNDERLLAAKESAESAYRAKSRFLAAASHDIRQPAHALGMFVGRLTSVPHDAVTSELVHGVEASVRSLQEMLDVFFDYSKLDSESVGLNLKPISIKLLFQQLSLSYDSIAFAKGLALHIRNTDLWVVSDKVLLQRVLLNLVSNAVKYTESGKVLVACRPTRSGNHVRLEVWDTGIGIAPSELDMIFEEFYQIDNSERDRSKGLGLGLSMVKRSCDLLSHRLKVNSRLGRGTQFSILVPVAQTPPVTVGSALEVTSATTGDLEDLRVMVIEDDALSRTAITGLLTSWGCQVSTFQDADSACASVGEIPAPTVIVSDYRLPGQKSGIDAIRFIREVCGSHIFSILISGDKNEDLRQIASDEGLFLLTKPLQPAKLRSLLRRL